MKKLLGTLILVAAMVLAMAVPASAFEICFSRSGDEFKLEVTQVGNFFQLVGSERIPSYRDNPVIGTAFITPDGRVRIGLLSINGYPPITSGIIWDADLSLATLSGDIFGYVIDGRYTIYGTLSVIPCG